MVALMARMFVCSASSATMSSTVPICCDFFPSSSMWLTIRSTCLRMPRIVSVPRATVVSPERAACTVRSAMRATRWALSAIWRDAASSSLIVVAISFMAVACSRAPVACWFDAVCSSVDEL